MQHLDSCVLIDLIKNERYGVEYQPIVNLSSGDIFAYEALSRFFDESGNRIAPDIVYASLHSSPLSLCQVEYQQKVIQLLSAPVSTNLFINLDQDSFYASCKTDDNNKFLKLFKNHKKNRITVELIENSHINDAKMSLKMINSLLLHNIPSAIDDVFGPLSMLSFDVIQFVNFVKLDKSVLLRKQDKDFMELVRLIIEYCRFSGKKIILEGVEKKIDLEFATKLKVDYVQGFLFKERFISSYSF